MPNPGKEFENRFLLEYCPWYLQASLIDQISTEVSKVPYMRFLAHRLAHGSPAFLPVAAANAFGSKPVRFARCAALSILQI